MLRLVRRAVRFIPRRRRRHRVGDRLLPLPEGTQKWIEDRREWSLEEPRGERRPR